MASAKASSSSTTRMRMRGTLSSRGRASVGWAPGWVHGTPAARKGSENSAEAVQSRGPPSHRGSQRLYPDLQLALLEWRNLTAPAPRRPSPRSHVSMRPTPPGPEAALLEATPFDIKKVIVGQDRAIERLLVGLISRGHVLLEGVPGLAKTLAVETLAAVTGGS